ncbi:MAG: MIP family channel protein [Oscillospiraceae bacterium]|nr:MIP family channel protein [Oscillospiraceae bacterium]
MTTFKKMLAEFIGTCVLVVFGCGVAIVSRVDLVATALAFGLVIVAMAYSVGNVSGCHINPAVSFGMLVAGKMKLVEFFEYICAQFLGGIAGAGILCAFFGKESGLGANALQTLEGGNKVEIWQGLVVEVILTFVFVFAILGVTSKKEFGSAAGIVIGLTLTLVHLLGIALTGTSVNPARSFGPALLAGGDALNQVWIFILAPLVGACIAALVFRALSGKEQEA